MVRPLIIALPTKGDLFVKSSSVSRKKIKRNLTLTAGFSKHLGQFCNPISVFFLTQEQNPERNPSTIFGQLSPEMAILPVHVVRSLQ
jgi:hypothetical protein